MPQASNLILHCGAFNASKDQVASIETPSPTETWKPVPHIEIVDLILEQAQSYGLVPRREQYGLNKDGSRLFGVIDFEKSTEDYGYSVGFRNSHDKTMAAGVCAGARVIVCDNLALAGNYSRVHKHTSNLNIQALIKDAFILIPGQIEALMAKMSALKQVPLSEEEAKILIFDAGLRNVFPSNQLLPIWEEYVNPRFVEWREYRDTKYGVLMAVTELTKKFSQPMRLEQAYQRMADVFFSEGEEKVEVPTVTLRQ